MGNCGTSAKPPFVLTPSGSCQPLASATARPAPRLGAARAAGAGLRGGRRGGAAGGAGGASFAREASAEYRGGWGCEAWKDSESALRKTKHIASLVVYHTDKPRFLIESNGACPTDILSCSRRDRRRRRSVRTEVQPILKAGSVKQRCK